MLNGDSLRINCYTINVPNALIYSTLRGEPFRMALSYATVAHLEAAARNTHGRRHGMLCCELARREAQRRTQARAVTA